MCSWSAEAADICNLVVVLVVFTLTRLPTPFEFLTRDHVSVFIQTISTSRQLIHSFLIANDEYNSIPFAIAFKMVF